MKIINIDNKADEKRYGVKSLIKDMEELHEKDGIEVMAIVYKKKNGRIGIGATYGNNAEIVGLLEMGKWQYIEDF